MEDNRADDAEFLMVVLPSSLEVCINSPGWAWFVKDGLKDRM